MWFRNSSIIPLPSAPLAKFQLEKLTFYLWYVSTFLVRILSIQQMVAKFFKNFCQNVSKSYLNRLYVSTSPVGIFRRVDGRGIIEKFQSHMVFLVGILQKFSKQMAFAIVMKLKKLLRNYIENCTIFI